MKRHDPAPGERLAFATPADLQVCRRLHERHGTTYAFATRRFSPALRDRVHALYGFVRLPDEWVDNPTRYGITNVRDALTAFREELRRGVVGERPEEPVLRAFCDLMKETGMGLEEPECFLDAMEMDLNRTRYATYEDLRSYMRGSACAVGLMMLGVLDCDFSSPELREPACALGEAMQLT
ncbi:MAG: phytoene synthase, partial [Armatimonadota bacterium]